VACPQSNFFIEDTLKKLAQTAYDFSRSPGPGIKASFLLLNVDLKKVALKQLIRKFLNTQLLLIFISPNIIF
jgi:hypothetical protein